MENKWLNEAFKGEMPNGVQGKVGWQSPSNIALVKYWGKRGKQLPQNPSISFTLSECRSETFVNFEKADRFGFQFFFEGKETPAFGAKIEKFLLENQVFFPFINQLRLKVESHNTFPHSSGIASSASSMSAFVMCLMEIESLLVGPSTGSGTLTKASYFSRLASGSASRSVFPKMALWGATDCYKGSSDEYAVSLENDIHPVFKTFIADKKVSKWINREYEKMMSFNGQLKTKSVDEEYEKKDKKEEGEELTMTDVAAALIVRHGVDAHYVMYEMDLWEIQPYLNAADIQRKSDLITQRFWTYLTLSPNINTKKVKSPEELVPFDWEKKENKVRKDLEENGAAAFAFLSGNNNKEEKE